MRFELFSAHFFYSYDPSNPPQKMRRSFFGRSYCTDTYMYNVSTYYFTAIGVKSLYTFRNENLCIIDYYIDKNTLGWRFTDHIVLLLHGY